MLNTIQRIGKISFGAVRRFSSSAASVKIKFVEPDGYEEVVSAKVGDSILDVAIDHDIDIEGACGGEIACSTCHVIFDEKTFNT